MVLKMKRIIVFLLFVTLAVAGCKSTSKRPEAPKVAVPKAITDPRVVMEPAVTNWLRILKVDASTAGRFMRVEIDVQNGSRTLQRFSYGIDWLDAKGDLIEGVSSRGAPWTLQAGEASALIITSPTPLAKDFRAKFVANPIQ